MKNNFLLSLCLVLVLALVTAKTNLMSRNRAMAASHYNFDMSNFLEIANGVYSVDLVNSERTIKMKNTMMFMESNETLVITDDIGILAKKGIRLMDVNLIKDTEILVTNVKDGKFLLTTKNKKPMKPWWHDKDLRNSPFMQDKMKENPTGKKGV